MLGAEAHIGIGGKMKDEIGALHGLRQRRGVGQKIAFDQVKIRVLDCRLEETPVAGRQIVKADDAVAVREQAIGQVAADEAGGSGDEIGFLAHGSEGPSASGAIAGLFSIAITGKSNGRRRRSRRAWSLSPVRLPIAEHEYAVDGTRQDHCEPPGGGNNQCLVKAQPAGRPDRHCHGDLAATPAHIKKRHVVDELKKRQETGDHAKMRGEPDRAQDAIDGDEHQDKVDPGDHHLHRGPAHRKHRVVAGEQIGQASG